MTVNKDKLLEKHYELIMDLAHEARTLSVIHAKIEQLTLEVEKIEAQLDAVEAAESGSMN